MMTLRNRRGARGLIDLLEERRLFAAYSIVDLGTLGGGASHAFAVNASGQVVGDAQTAGGATHAFLDSNGTMTDLGTLGGSDSHAYGINDLGQVVGDSLDASGNTHAFIYSAGVMTDLGTLGGSSSSAQGINASGEVVGYSTTAGGATHAFSKMPSGALSDLGTLGGTSSFAYNINASGQIVGYSTLSSGAERAFLYSAGTMTNLGTLGGPQSFAYHGINDAGNVAGDSSANNTTEPFHGFVYSGSATLKDIGTLGGTDIFVRDINNAGQVVGKSLTASGGNYDAYVYSNGKMTDLNGQIASAGWVLNNAEGINTPGQIVGTGLLNGSEHAYLLTPTGGGGGGGVTGVLTPTIGKSTVPKAVISGKPVHGSVSVKLTNSSGSTVKGLTTITLLASTDTTADAGDATVLTLKKKVNLKSHKSAVFQLNLKSLPAGIASGTYTLIAEAADPSGNVAATTTGPSITTAAPFVALSEIIGATAPATLKAGKGGTVSITLTNSGNIDTTGKAAVELGGSADGVAETLSFGTQQVAIKVKAGKKSVIRLKLKVPAGAAPGTYHAFVSVAQNSSTATGIGSSTFTISA